MARNSLNRRLRYLYLRFTRLRGSPQELALGMALGIFVGIMPVVPFQMASAVALALLFRASKITAVAGTWISNPVTIYPIYKYCYDIGSLILGFDRSTKVLGRIAGALNAGEFLDMARTILSGGGQVVLAFLLGGMVLGIICAVPSYFLVSYFFKALHTWRKARKSQRSGKIQGFRG